MINRLFARLQRPERGFDPVPAAYAAEYCEQQWGGDAARRVDEVERRLGPVAGRDVLDLGGGPGHVTAEFLRRGARVTWHDVSDNYRRLARERLAADAGRVAFRLGYLEEAEGEYDLVFNCICWYYSASDRRFARKVHRLVRAGGSAYIVTPYLEAPAQTVGLSHRLRGRLNDRLGLKIGHPFPTLGLFARVWRGLEMQRFEMTHDERNVTLLFQR